LGSRGSAVQRLTDSVLVIQARNLLGCAARRRRQFTRLRRKRPLHGWNGAARHAAERR
jgi:hypothetical protein